MTGLGLSLNLSQSLTLRQRIALLIQETVITPDGVCPGCGHKLSEEEIQAGWRNDPRDYTTKCPKCSKRFVALLRLTDNEKKEIGSHNYLCRIQLFAELKSVQRGKSGRLGMYFLTEKHPELFWNMIRHFGSYKLGLEAFHQK